jgi:hypothetical protein
MNLYSALTTFFEVPLICLAYINIFKTFSILISARPGWFANGRCCSWHFRWQSPVFCWLWHCSQAIWRPESRIWMYFCQVAFVKFLFLNFPLLFTYSRFNALFAGLERSQFSIFRISFKISHFQLLRLFPPQSALRDSYSLFGSSFAYVIFEDISQPNGGGNILEPSRLKEVTKLHKMILHNVTTVK